MLNLKSKEKQRSGLSLDKKRLTLSVNKVLISPLSSSLFKFFESEQSSNQECQNQKFRKSKRTWSVINLPKNQNIKNDKQQNIIANKRSQQHKMNEYGFPFRNSKDGRNLKVFFPRLRSTSKLNKLRLKSTEPSQISESQKLKCSSEHKENNPYLNFTFGHRQLRLK